MSKIPVGISQCLLGDAVRYNGGHKHDRYITEVLGQYLEFRPVCPEVAIGLGVPRQPIRLIATDAGDRVRGGDDPRRDVTEPLAEQAELALSRMPELCGYIFMQNSPSCGAFSMKRFTENGNLKDNHGRGAFARRLMQLKPYLPVEEAGRLNDPGLLENFIARVFALHDWKQSIGEAPSPAKLVAFYSRYKYQVMAHHYAGYKQLGRLVANLTEQPIEDVSDVFLQLFMDALSRLADRKGNCNALLHLRGYLKGRLDAAENEELDRLITAYREKEVPLAVPLNALKHHALNSDDLYLKQQSFWSPHPEALRLRSAMTRD